MSLDLIKKYFPTLTDQQLNAYAELQSLYATYNEKVNLISRKDIENLYLHHVLHSLTLTKFVNWNSNCSILDLGTGGGFPAIPLAIYYPEIKFTAIDGTGKKIKVVQEIAAHLNLKNLDAQHLRAEDCKSKFHFVVSRAVTSLQQLCTLSKPLLLRNSVTALPNGIIAYKGGDIKNELKEIKSRAYYETWDIYDEYQELYYLEKYLIYLQLH